MNLAIYLFLAGMGVVMSTALWWWQRALNGSRRVPHWIITVQMLGWNLFLIRSSIFLFGQNSPTNPSWWLVTAIALMDAGQAGHLWAILNRTHALQSIRRKHGTAQDM